MKKQIRTFLFIGLIAFISFSAVAQNTQKIGYINTALLMSQMQEVKDAEALLDTLQKQLAAQGQALVDSFQTKYESFVKQNEAGELNPKQIADAEASLGEGQKKIQEFDNQMKFALLQRREQIMPPIYDKINQAIQEVAREQGYTHIFDTSQGSNLIFVDAESNIINAVKTKLGVPLE